MTYRNQCSKLLCNKIGDSRCLLLESLVTRSPHTHTHTLARTGAYARVHSCPSMLTTQDQTSTQKKAATRYPCTLGPEDYAHVGLSVGWATRQVFRDLPKNQLRARTGASKT